MHQRRERLSECQPGFRPPKETASQMAHSFSPPPLPRSEKRSRASSLKQKVDSFFRHPHGDPLTCCLPSPSPAESSGGNNLPSPVSALASVLTSSRHLMRGWFSIPGYEGSALKLWLEEAELAARPAKGNGPRGKEITWDESLQSDLRVLESERSEGSHGETQILLRKSQSGKEGEK